MRNCGATRPYADVMPRYEFRCRACGETFELSRPMAEANAPAECPNGHDDTVKLLSTIGVSGLAQAPSSAGGGCCGGGCCGG
ncbi:conserved hypothetical protein [Thermobifida fusca YX]|uniref:Putative regulatory protein FmdB zinc ribbon domain-containing protein n=3 Tax=Nocardiopsidaceae TaxID=83676 RepID=A0A9P2TA39_THEFU|nr:conserved hypothetical protein [Thermobifida fusca YX]EOR70694.1 hypothetical protein TM51_11360 [Thermobifida fusca TM51]